VAADAGAPGYRGSRAVQVGKGGGSGPAALGPGDQENLGLESRMRPWHWIPPEGLGSCGWAVGGLGCLAPSSQ
jgi:hypothetical protein